MRLDKQSKWYFFSWSTVLNQMQNTENKDDLKTNIWNLSYHKRTLKLFLMLGHTQKLHYIGFPQKSCSGNTCDGVSFLIRLGLQYATLFEKRFQHIFSPINLKKNFRTDFLHNSSVRIFLGLIRANSKTTIVLWFQEKIFWITGFFQRYIFSGFS